MGIPTVCFYILLQLYNYSRTYAYIYEVLFIIYIYGMFSVKWIQDIQVVVSENVSEYKYTMYIDITPHSWITMITPASEHLMDQDIQDEAPSNVCNSCMSSS